uniref:Peptidase S49 domain-containing protein n=1 Tax=Aureoumbra lagunensis TaxID=44058 RepID=A0A7S3K1Z5_9STRA|mmetsp:Transcript_1495/g.2197  ORF Transcript_1495/g.2197 Transcript_1495/m.2197 type:complete len:638 (+) Transcript_1495:68-1981(+)
MRLFCVKIWFCVSLPVLIESFVVPHRRVDRKRIGTNVVVPDWVGDLGIQLSQTIITWSVPIIGGVLIASSFKGNKEEGLVRRQRELELEFGLEDEDSTSSLFRGAPPGFGPAKKIKRNRIPTPSYLKIERLNDRLESFSFDLKSAEIGRFAALKQRRRARLARAFKDEVNITALSENDLKTLGQAEINYKRASNTAREAARSARSVLRALAVSATPETMEAAMEDDDDNLKDTSSESKIKDKSESVDLKNPMSMMNNMFEQRDAEKKLSEAILQEARAEASFLETVSRVVTEKNAQTRITQLVFASRDDDLFSATNHQDNSSVVFGKTLTSLPRVFVLNFNGDVTASQTRELRQEITALLQIAQEGRDEVVLRLSTGGGTVTGYGSAAGQLTRLKDAGLKLTVCVEEVAASGGYLMACAADHLIASPFAVLGSIGVISDIPNVYERLRREGVEFQTVTAGKYKRTITPTKKITSEDLAKSKADLEDVLKLFKSWVAQNRPSLDIDSVATGETWYGERALEKGLCDELRTFDDVLLDKLHSGADVFSITYRDPKPNPSQLFSDFASGLLFEEDASLASGSFGTSAMDSLRQFLIRALIANGGKDIASSSLQVPPSSSRNYLGRHENMYMINNDPPTFF